MELIKPVSQINGQFFQGAPGQAPSSSNATPSKKTATYDSLTMSTSGGSLSTKGQNTTQSHSNNSATGDYQRKCRSDCSNRRYRL